MPYVEESKHHDRLLQSVRLYNAADEALRVLTANCVPATGPDDAAAIMHAQNTLRNVIRLEPGDMTRPGGGRINDADRLDIIRNLILRTQPGGNSVLDLAAVLPQVLELTAR